MASTHGRPASDLVGAILPRAKNHSFFRLVERIHQLYADDLESISSVSAGAVARRLRLRSDARLAFPASDVLRAAPLPGNGGGKPLPDRYEIVASFFGLHGSDSPLPGYYLDVLAYESAHRVGVRPAMFDYFNHRLLKLLHQVWRKYRYRVRFQPEARDRFSGSVFALIGLAGEQVRGSTPIAWSRMLTYAGTVAGRSRAPSVIAGIIAHCFDLERVLIRAFEPRYVSIRLRQRTHLHSENCKLGKSFVLGKRVRSVAGKFVVVMPGLTLGRFQDFLPAGRDFEPLRKLIEFLLRDQLAYDLELGIVKEAAPRFTMGRQSDTSLGWTTFLARKEMNCDRVVRITGRR
jgi:type VI secretion system protein ImpH